MYKTQRWITFDRKEHRSYEAAEEYLQEKRGAIITKMAQELAGLELKYSAIINYLDENLDTFAVKLCEILDDTLDQGES